MCAYDVSVLSGRQGGSYGGKEVEERDKERLKEREMVEHKEGE